MQSQSIAFGDRLAQWEFGELQFLRVALLLIGWSAQFFWRDLDKQTGTDHFGSFGMNDSLSFFKFLFASCTASCSQLLGRHCFHGQTTRVSQSESLRRTDQDCLLRFLIVISWLFRSAHAVISNLQKTFVLRRIELSNANFWLIPDKFLHQKKVVPKINCLPENRERCPRGDLQSLRTEVRAHRSLESLMSFKCSSVN